MIELILALSLMAILSAVLMPSLRPFLSNISSSTSITTITKELHFVRSRAIADPNLHVGLFLDTIGTPDSIITFFDDDNDYHYTRGSDRVVMAGFALPEAAILVIPSGFPEAIVFRGDGSAKQSALFLVNQRYNRLDSISVLASTGRIKSTKKVN